LGFSLLRGKRSSLRDSANGMTSYDEKFEKPPSENDEEPEFLYTFLKSIYFSSAFVDKTLKISLFFLITFM
jgi:hypothetical protein